MVTMRQALGEVLRAHRQAAGVTLRDLAERSNVSLGYISEIERGQKEASSELLQSLATGLNLSLSVLMRDVSEVLAVHETCSLEAARAAKAANNHAA